MELKKCQMCGKSAMVDADKLESKWWCATVTCESLCMSATCGGTTKKAAIESASNAWNRMNCSD